MFHVPAHKNVQQPAGQVDGGGTVALEDQIFHQTVRRACLDKVGRNAVAPAPADYWNSYYRNL